MLLLDAFGLFFAAALACAVWGPDVWRWMASRLGLSSKQKNGGEEFGVD